MPLLKKSEFARLAKVSPQAIDQKIKKGHLDVVGEGRSAKIDTDSVKAKDYLNDINSNRMRAKEERAHEEKKPKREPKPKPEKKPKPIKKKKIEQPPEPPEEDLDIVTRQDAETVLESLPEDLRQMSKYDLDRLRIATTILKETTKHQIERDNYIPRQTVERVFSALYQIDNQEFLQLPPILASAVCEVLELSDPDSVMKITAALNDYVYRTQRNIRDALNYELKKMKMDGVL